MLLMEDLLEKPNALKTILFGVLVGWGSTLRPESCVLMASISCALLFSQNGRRMLLWMITPFIGWIIFMVMWFKSRQSTTTEFGGDINALLSYWPSHIFEVIPFSFELIRVYLLQTWRWLRYIPEGISNIICVFLVVLIIIGVTAGFTDIWRHQKKARPILLSIALFSFFYFAVHIFWHVPEPRYLIPLLPFTAAFLVRFGNKSLHITGKKKILLVLVFAALFIPAIYESGRAVYKSFLVPNPLNSPPLKSLKWLRENSPPTARVTSNIAASVDLYSDRDAMGVITIDNGDEFTYLLLKQRIDYIVMREALSVTPGVGATEDPNVVFNRYKRWLRFYPDRFPRIFYEELEKTGIYQVLHIPHFIEAYEKYIVASELANAGKYSEAVPEINEALRLLPTLGCANNLLGALLFIGKQYEEAEKYFIKASNYAPDSSMILLNLANCSYRRQDFRQSDAYIAKAVTVSKLSGNEVEFQNNLKKLKGLWEQGKSTLFFKSPNVHLYEQMKD
jgi:tetratricopeptide (TPR) repeat protein